MGKLITIVGNSGVGKTTLAQLLCRRASFATGLEHHRERPFHDLFASDLARYALANQFDFLLYRAEQEMSIRQSEMTGIQDGGLDQDFFVFTRHFVNKGFLSESEYQLCQRLYLTLRAFLSPPDLIIRLTAPLPVVLERYARRNRQLEITAAQDLADIETLLDEWLGKVEPKSLLSLDVSANDPQYSEILDMLLDKINARLPD